MAKHRDTLRALAGRISALKESTLKDKVAAKEKLDLPARTWGSDARLTGAVEDLMAASKQVADCSSKLVLVLKNPKCTDSAAASICDEFGVANEVLVTALTVLETAQPCGLLWAEAVSVVHALESAALELVPLLGSASSGLEGEEAAVVATGVVRNLAATSFRLLPKTCRVAYRRGIMAKSTLVKETLDEFQALVNKGPRGDSDDDNDGGGGGGGGDELDDFDYFMGGDGGGGGGGGTGEDDDEKYSAAEHGVAVACLVALALARPTLKAALEALDVAAATAEAVAAGPLGGAAAEAPPSPQSHAQSQPPNALPAAGDAAATPPPAAAAEAAAAAAAAAPALDLWRVAEVWALAKRLEGAVTGLGLALYAPVDKAAVTAASAELGAVGAELGAVLVAVAFDARKAAEAAPAVEGAGAAETGAAALSAWRAVGGAWATAMASLDAALAASGLE